VSNANVPSNQALTSFDLLMQFGSASRCGGAERLMFDKSALKRMRRHLGGDRGLKLIDRWLNVYAVIGDNGQLITAAHKHRHFYR
jgi:hypothetical protein